MRLQRTLAAIGVLIAASIPAYAPAQVESTPIPALAKPNFASMSFMVGTWTCSTKSSRRPAPFVTTSTYAMDPSGYWMTEDSTTNATSWIPTKLSTNDKITYDPDTKRWVDVLSGDQGTYGLSVSKGWNGNQVVWHDLAFMPTAQVGSQTNTTITKVSDAKMTTSSSFTEAKTGRKITVAGTCTKG